MFYCQPFKINSISMRWERLEKSPLCGQLALSFCWEAGGSRYTGNLNFDQIWIDDNIGEK